MMIQLANAESAIAPRTKYATKVGIAYAIILIIMTVGQLYAFEKFIPIMTDYLLPGGHGTASLVAGLIVITEVFALPFLLRMRVSRLMRWVSLVCGVLVPIIWLKLALTAVFGMIVLTNSGMLGEKVPIPTGAAQVVLSLVLLALAAWSVYGLWPVRKK